MKALDNLALACAKEASRPMFLKNELAAYFANFDWDNNKQTYNNTEFYWECTSDDIKLSVKIRRVRDNAPYPLWANSIINEPIGVEIKLSSSQQYHTITEIYQEFSDLLIKNIINIDSLRDIKWICCRFDMFIRKMKSL